MFLKDIGGGWIALKDMGAITFFAAGSFDSSLLNATDPEATDDDDDDAPPNIGGIATGLAGVSANGTEQNVGCSSSYSRCCC